MEVNEELDTSSAAERVIDEADRALVVLSAPETG